MNGLVGRTDELTRLVAAFDGLSSGGSAWVRVTGEPGIGKTRLVGELCGIAAERNAVVLGGCGAELESDLPFGLVIDAFDDHLGSLEEDRLARLCGRQGGELRRLFPALDIVRRPRHQVAEDQRYPTYRALRLLVARLADPGPLVLVFDDLHWADSASLGFVSFLLAHPLDAPVLMVLSWRPGEAPGLSDTLSMVACDLPGAAVVLAGLAEEAVGELLAEADRPKLRSVFEASGGNPFYAQALASYFTQHRRSGHRSDTYHPDDLDIPGAVAAAVGHEIGSLSKAAQLLAQGAAVAGEPFEAEMAARYAALGTSDVDGALQELVTRGIIRSAQSPRRFAFRHPIVRHAVYESAGLGWRLGAHSRAASVLAERDAPIASIAHHIAISAVPGDLAAAQLLVDAATEAASRAPASARLWLDAAHAIVPRRPDSLGTRLQLLTARARISCVLGDLHAAHDAFAEIFELVHPDDPGYVSMVARSAGVEHGLGRFVEARGRMLGALEHVGGTDVAAEAVLSIELAVSNLYTLDFEEAAAFADRAARAAAGCDRLLEGTARALLAFVHVSAETAEGSAAARCHANEAAAILDSLDDDEVAARLDALYYLGWAERLFERYDMAQAHLDRAVALA